MTSEAPQTTLLDQVCADIDCATRPLRFSDAIEERYQTTRRPERIRHFVKTSATGLIVYNLFLFSDAFLVPDILHVVKLLHIAITLIAALNVSLVFRKVFPPEMAAFNLTLTFAQVLFNVHCSHSPDAVFLLFTIPVFYIYSNIVLPLPFRLALQFSAFCVLVTSAAIAVQPGLHLGVKILLFIVEAALAGYTLIATYRSEVFERRSYLLTLRETLRGESLAEKNRQLRDLSDTDGLTGIPNRRFFDLSFERLWREHSQTAHPLALLVVDIDHFKRLNDTFGHLHGDHCLRMVSERLRSLMRQRDCLARFGGEEFAVLLTDDDAASPAEVAERLRAAIEAMPVPLGGNTEPHHITVSIGCATLIPRPGMQQTDLFLMADSALYAAKRGGRNRVHTHNAAAPMPVPEPHATPVPRPLQILAAVEN